MTTAGALLRLARPKQWVKNVLVLAAPGAAGVLSEGDAAMRSGVAFVALSLTASGTYAWNDLLDVEADRSHPTKCNRPIASGAVSIRAAGVFGVILLTAGVALAFAVNSHLGSTVLAYAFLTIAYSTWLKHEPVLDLVTVAAGFVLRTIAGATAAEVTISPWFLIVAGAGSLFIVTGKRSAEVKLLGTEAAGHRRALSSYSESFLLYVRALSSTVAVVGYCLWAFQVSSTIGNQVWFEASIVPFVVCLLRYALLLDQGEGGAPEDLLLSDRVLLVVGVVWVGVFAGAVYFA